MSNLKILLASISAIVLFLYGLDGFSKEIQRAELRLFHQRLDCVDANVSDAAA
jgi:hypothetical protein